MTADYLVKKGEIKFAILLDICKINNSRKKLLTKGNQNDNICLALSVSDTQENAGVLELADRHV